MNTIPKQQDSGRLTIMILAAIMILACFLKGAFFFELQNNPLPQYISQTPGFDQYNFVALAKHG